MYRKYYFPENPNLLHLILGQQLSEFGRQLVQHKQFLPPVQSSPLISPTNWLSFYISDLKGMYTATCICTH